MLTFEEAYFKEEVRCDFVVPEKMKRAWAAEMEVLAEIDRICKKYGLTYYANWGTLLGAVRHKGFVPWDDDIDIALKRSDYMKFLRVVEEEMPVGWNISSMYTSQKHKQPISCLMNTKRIHTEPKVIERFHGCPYIVGVDIYPLDYVPRNAELAETQRRLYGVVYDAAHRFAELNQSGEMEKYLPQIETLCGVKFNDEQPLRKQLWLLSDRLAALFTEEESDYLTWLPRMVRRSVPFLLKKEWYQETIQMSFENITVPVPVGYHEVLQQMYGDYSILRRGGGAHNYPFYKRQDEFLEKLGVASES